MEHTKPPATAAPVRPRYDVKPGDDTAAYYAVMHRYDIRRAEFDEDEEARALKAGQAVYDLMRDAEAKYWLDVKTDRGTLVPNVNIAPADFRDFMAWFVTYGGARFGLQPAMEFSMFSGAVLVVVR